jgi:hypothetical protein
VVTFTSDKQNGLANIKQRGRGEYTNMQKEETPQHLSITSAQCFAVGRPQILTFSIEIDCTDILYDFH